MAANQNFPVNTQSPVTIAYVTSPTVPAASPNQRYKVKAARITGGLQITCAVLSGISGVMAILLATCAIGDVETCSRMTSYGQYLFPAVIGWPIWGAVFVSGIIS